MIRVLLHQNFQLEIMHQLKDLKQISSPVSALAYYYCRTVFSDRWLGHSVTKGEYKYFKNDYIWASN